MTTSSLSLPSPPLGPLQALDHHNQSPLFRRRANTREREHLRQIQAAQQHADREAAALTAAMSTTADVSEYVPRQPKPGIGGPGVNNNTGDSLNLNV